jgi:DNA-cytosine methyltransferase
MTHGSLFSGIGGFDLASEWIGWDNIFHCEWNEFGQRVLKHHFPKSISYGDITTTDFTIHRGQIDILTGGFPCQPYSQAGKRLGKEDDRHLWPEMLRAIREIQPRWVVGENVLGLVNWNGGLVFDEVQADLENEGYVVQPYVLPACAVNAPHRRDRVWFVAHSTYTNSGSTGASRKNRETQGNGRKNDDESQSRGTSRKQHFGRSKFLQPTSDSNRNGQHGSDCEHEIEPSQRGVDAQRDVEPICGDDSNSDSIRLERGFNKDGKEREISGQYATALHPSIGRAGFKNFPTQSPVRLRDDGFSRILVRYLTNEVFDAISQTSQENRIQNVQEVWSDIQSPKIWEQIRGLYALESKDILLQTMQLYSGAIQRQGKLSPFSEDFSKDIVRDLQKHGEFRRSPHGRELEEQRSGQYPNLVPQLPHEVALASKAFEKTMLRFDSWHRQESVKAYGNAIVPQVAHQIFKAIEQYECQASPNP